MLQPLSGSGSPTRARTWDLRINSPSLYQLSYRGFETPTSVSPEKLEGAYSNSPQGAGQRDGLKINRSGCRRNGCLLGIMDPWKSPQGRKRIDDPIA